MADTFNPGASGNFFDQFDEDTDGALVVTPPQSAEDNPFDTFDADPDAAPPSEPAPPSAPTAPTEAPSQALKPLEDMPGISFSDDPILNGRLDQLDAVRRKQAEGEKNQASGEGFIAGIKASIAANRQKTAQTSLDVLQRIDKGEEIAPQDDPLGLRLMTPEQQKAMRASFQQNIADPTHDPFAEAALDPQQYIEVGKGVPPGAVRFGGSMLQGVAAAQSAPFYAKAQVLRNRLKAFDAIDRGEHVTNLTLTHELFYQTSSPEERAKQRAELEQEIAQYSYTPPQERAAYKTGTEVIDYAATILPAEPGYEEAVGRQLGEGLGSMVAGLPFGVIGRIPALAAFASAGSGEALQRAIQYDAAERAAGRAGLTQDQITASGIWGTVPGSTDILSVETLLGRLKIPLPLRIPLARAIARIGGQAFVEGFQEGGQQFMQNLIAQEIYNPEQRLTEGVTPNAGMGAGVGGLAQTAKEVGALILKSMAGRRARRMPFPGDQPDLQQAQKEPPIVQFRRDAAEIESTLPPVPESMTRLWRGNRPNEVGVGRRFTNDLPGIALPFRKAYAGTLSYIDVPTSALQDYVETGAVARNAEFILPDNIAAQAVSIPAIETAEVREAAARFTPRVARPTESAGVDVVQFIRGKGGLKPSGELRAVNAERYPGLVRESGLEADKMREALVEAGYLEEAGPDQPAVTTPQDVYDLVARQIEGERVFPIAERAGAASLAEQSQAYEQDRELVNQEENFVLPELARIDDEVGADVVTSAYARLSNDEKAEVIERHVRGGEAVDDVIEEIAMRNQDEPAVAALTIGRAVRTGEAQTIRNAVEQEAPDLVAEFDDMIAALPEATGVRPAAVSEPAPTAAAISDDTRGAFADLIDSRTPASQWADRLGITQDELTPLIDEAVNKGWLQRDASGNVRRAQKTSRTGAIAPMVISDAVPATLPGEGDVGLTPQAEEKWPGVRAAVDKAAARILPDAVSVEVKDAIQIARLKQEDQLYAVREMNAAFWRWFGDSKVVDENGQPLVVYHGTQSELGKEFAFKDKLIGSANDAGFFGRGYYFASTSGEAGFYGPNVGSFYLSLKNPLDLSNNTGDLTFEGHFLSWYPKLREIGYTTPDVDAMYQQHQEIVSFVEDNARVIPAGDPASIKSGYMASATHPVLGEERTGVGFREEWPKTPEEAKAQLVYQFVRAMRYHEEAFPQDMEYPSLSDYIRVWHPESARGLTDAAKAAGYDGIAYGDEYVAFSPTQIKSIFNRGTYDPLDPRISYALRKMPPETQAGFSAIVEERTAGVAGVNSPEFQRWFAGSEVIDDAGQPIVLYHATGAVFDEFQPGKDGGIHFGTAAQANMRAPARANVIPVYLHAKKLKRIRDSEGNWKKAIARAKREGYDGIVYLNRYEGIPREEFQVAYDKGMSQELMDKIPDKKFRKEFPSAEDSYIVFNAGQIKSALEVNSLPGKPRGGSLSLEETQSREQPPEDRTAAGREGVEADQGEPAPGAPAGTGEGMPAALGGTAPGLARTADERIIRQESASLRGDGSVIVGRQSREAAPSERGEAAERSQPSGAIEDFDISGYDGRVTAEFLEDADRNDGNLARLSYRIYQPGQEHGDQAEIDRLEKQRDRLQAKLEKTRFGSAAQSKLINQLTDIDERLDDIAPTAKMHVVQRSDGAWEIDYVSSRQPQQGIGTKLYDAVEKDLGIRMSPSGILTDAGLAFWRKRSPASVQWHVPSPIWAGLNLSPRKVLEGMERTNEEIRRLGAGVGTARHIPADQREETIAKLQKERGQLRRLYVGLPEEARARRVLDQMFAIRAFHGTPHEFERFDISRIGTGEGAQAFGHGLYFAENELTAQAYRRQLTGPERFQLNGKNLPDSTNPFAIERYAQMKMDGNTDGLNAEKTQIEQSIRLLKERLQANKYRDAVFREVEQEDLRIARDQLDVLEKIEAGEVTRSLPGVLYEVSIDVEPEDLLDWDKPLDQQGPEVKKVVSSVLPQKLSEPEIRKVDGGFQIFIDGEPVSAPYGRRVDAEERIQAGVRTSPIDESVGPLTGMRLYRELEKIHGSPDAVSNVLREAGIYGIRYLDQGSRAQVSVPLLDGKKIAGNAALDTAGVYLRRANGDSEIAVEDLSRTIQQMRKPEPDMVEAVAMLRDGRVSLGEPKVSHNIVIFDDSLVKITHKNGKPVTGKERQDIVDQMFAVRRIPPAREPEALGQTDPYKMIISIAMRAVEAEARAKGVSAEQEAVRVLRHESVEFFKEMGLFTDKEWATLKSAAKRLGWVETTGVRAAYEAIYKGGMSEAELEDLLVKEAIAEQFSEYYLNRKQYTGVAAEVFRRIKNFIRRLANFMRKEGFRTHEDVFDALEEGEFKRRFEIAFPELSGAQGERISPMAVQGRRRQTTLVSAPPAPRAGLELSAAGSVVDIQKELRRRLGLTVARGRLNAGEIAKAARKGETLVGQYDRQAGVIRLKVLEDIGSEAHEIAHALEDRYGLDRLKNAHTAELLGVARLNGKDTADDPLSEGFAEWYRLYLTNPQAAAQHAPNFQKAFEDYLNTEDRETLKAIQDIRDQYQQWRNASSAGRLIAAIKSGVKPRIWQEIRREYSRGGLTSVGGMFWRYLEQVHQSRLDATNPIRKLQMRIYYQAERNNRTLDFSAWKNPQMQAQKIRSMDGVSYGDITKGVSWENAAGRGTTSLRDALAHAFGGTAYEQWTDAQRDALSAYLIARRGRWLWQRFEMDANQFRGRLANAPANPQQGDWYFDTMRRERRVYLGARWESELIHEPDKHSRGDHEQAIKDLEKANPQFSFAAQMIYQFERDLALKRYQAGLDSREEYDYKAGSSDYVPWFRDMSDEIFAGTALAGRKVAPKFRIKGSYRDFLNPIEGIIRQVFDTNFEIGVNKPKLLLAQMADAVKGAGRYAEIIPATRMKVEEVKIRDALESAAREEGLPPEDAKQMISSVAAMLGEDAVATLFKADRAGEGRDAVLHYMDGGELKMLQIHDDGHGIARDILGFFENVRGTPIADSFANMLSAAVRTPQKGITSAIPFQWRNLIRDVQQATVLVAGYFPFISNARTVASNIARRARGDETWSDILARHAAIMGGIGRTDVQLLGQGRVAKLRTEGVTLRPWKREFWTQTLNPWHENFWRWAEWTEANTRQTIARIAFERTLRDAQSRYPTMSNEQQTFIALESAAQRSRDYTDYGKAGSKMMLVNRLVMFLNPSLQGWGKSVRAALLAETSEGIFATSQVIRKKLAPLFSDEFQKRDLTKTEVAALKDAFRIWLTIAIIANVHMLLEWAFNDPEDLKDKSELDRALYVTFTIDDEPYHIPRGFDLINIASNFVRTQYDSWAYEDPTAQERFKESLLYTLPPMSSPILDLYIGWRHNRDNFFQSDIEPAYMQGLQPQERYTAYTSNLSKKMAESINPLVPFDVSPIMVEYTMNSIGADWSRDILRAYDVFDPEKPALKWQEYPFIRSTRGLRGSRGSSDFWQLMGRDGEWQQVAGSYKTEAVDNKVWNEKEIRKFFDERVKDDDAKAYAILNGHYDADQRGLHPMVRARNMVAAVSATMRAVEFNRIDVPITSKISERVEVSRSARGAAKEILAEINRREYLNALIALQRPGYEGREPMPVDPYLKELEAVSPDIHKVLIDKLTKKGGEPRIYNYEEVRKFWPEMRRTLLDKNKIEDIIENDAQIEFHDLTYEVGVARATGIR